MMRKRKIFLIAAVLAVLMIVAVSCISITGGSGSFSQTLTPMSALMRATLTARAANSGEDAGLSTAIANATSQAIVVYATQTAEATPKQP